MKKWWNKLKISQKNVENLKKIYKRYQFQSRFQKKSTIFVEKQKEEKIRFKTRIRKLKIPKSNATLQKLWSHCSKVSVLKNKCVPITFLNPLWYGMYCYTLCHRFPAYYPLLLSKDVLLFLFHPSSIQHHNTTVAKNYSPKKSFNDKKLQKLNICLKVQAQTRLCSL